MKYLVMKMLLCTGYFLDTKIKPSNLSYIHEDVYIISSLLKNVIDILCFFNPTKLFYKTEEKSKILKVLSSQIFCP